ncbi:hypothetical protein NQ314_017486, partial [Rhamnusium bicolor]
YTQGPLLASDLKLNCSEIRPKRARTVFTSSQFAELEKEFIDNKYLCRIRKLHLAQSLNLSAKQVQIWF